MFYSYEILLQRNQNFALIWRVVHQPRKNFTRKDIVPINLEQACKELMQYIPTGVLSRKELEHKFSLYLLSQLMHGIVMVYDKKMSFIIKDLDEALKQLRPELLMVKAEKSAARKRERRTKTVDEIIEDQVGEVRTPKKRRSEARQREIPTARHEDITLREEIIERRDTLDVVNSMIVFGQEDLAPPTAEEREMFDREISRAGLRPVDQSILDTAPRKRRLEQPDETLASPHRISVEMPRRDTTMEHRLTEVSRPSTIVDLEFERLLQEKAPEVTTPTEREQDSGILLESIEIKAPAAKRRAHRKLMIDAETYISNTKMNEQIKNYDDLVKTREENKPKITPQSQLPLARLFNPRPIGKIHGDLPLKDELLELFDYAAVDKPVEKLTFEHAQHYPFTERFIRPDAKILIFEEEPEKFSYAELSLEFPKMSMAELEGGVPRPSSVSEIARRTTEASKLSGIIPTEPIILDEMEDQLRRQSAADLMVPPLERESMFMPPFPPLEIDMNEPVPEVKERSPPPMTPPPIGVALTPYDLLNDIKKSLEVSNARTVEFNDLVKTYDHREAAKSFYNLLALLKSREVKVQQPEAYGPIFIKLRDKPTVAIGEILA